MALRCGFYVEASRCNLVNHNDLGNDRAWLATNNKKQLWCMAWRLLCIKICLSLKYAYLDVTRSNQAPLSSVCFLCNWIVRVDKCVSEIVNISIYHLTVIGC